MTMNMEGHIKSDECMKGLNGMLTHAYVGVAHSLGVSAPEVKKLKSLADKMSKTRSDLEELMFRQFGADPLATTKVYYGGATRTTAELFSLDDNGNEEMLDTTLGHGTPNSRRRKMSTEAHIKTAFMLKAIDEVIDSVITYVPRNVFQKLKRQQMRLMFRTRFELEKRMIAEHGQRESLPVRGDTDIYYWKSVGVDLVTHDRETKEEVSRRRLPPPSEGYTKVRTNPMTHGLEAA